MGTSGILIAPEGYRWSCWCQFHQHFTRAFFVWKCFSIVTFWRKKHFRTKNAHVKCWWNWRQLALAINLQLALFIFSLHFNTQVLQYTYRRPSLFAVFTILRIKKRVKTTISPLIFMIKNVTSANNYETLILQRDQIIF